MVGVWLIVLASSSTPYGKVPRLILKETSRLAQAVVISEGIFCAARCCVIFHLQTMKVYLHMSNGNVQRTFYAQHSVTKNLHISPRSRLRFFIKMQSQCSYYYSTSTLLYSSIIRLYPQNPVFKIVHDESVKVYLPMYNGNVQQNPLCVESCVSSVLACVFLSRCKFSALTSTLLYSSRLCAQKTLCSKLFKKA